MNPNIPAHLIDATQAYPVGDDECMDGDGEVYPEHHYDGGVCRRCNAEADEEPEPEPDLDQRLRNAVYQLRDAVADHFFPEDYPQRLIAQAQAEMSQTTPTED